MLSYYIARGERLSCAFSGPSHWCLQIILLGGFIFLSPLSSNVAAPLCTLMHVDYDMMMLHVL